MTDRQPLPSTYATRRALRDARERYATTSFNNLVDAIKKDHNSMLEHWLHESCFMTGLGILDEGPRYALVSVSKFEGNSIRVTMDVSEKTADEYLLEQDYFGRSPHRNNGLVTLEKTITDLSEMEVARTEMAYALHLAKIEGLDRALAQMEANLLLAISQEAQHPEEDEHPTTEEAEDRPVRARRSRPVDCTGREREPMM
jgi:hypothetical protein